MTLNDSVFQASTPFRHAVSISKQIVDKEQANVLLKYSDGGVDDRNNLESVKCAYICMFNELNLDMVILCICAPGHSWQNPAERVMSILNLGLQICSLERKRLPEHEALLKICGSMKEIRQMSVKEPRLKEAYKTSIEPVQTFIQNRFIRLKLKDKPIETKDPITEVEIDLFKRHLR